VANIVKEFTGKTVRDVPSPATVSRMVRELSTVSNLQTGEALVSAPRINLSWDGTELNGSHLAETHVAVMGENGRMYFVLSIADMPGGTTQDYANVLEVRF
jgi:hypothetical protein